LTNVSGTLYGTTQSGGKTGSCSTCGTVFSISTSGKEKVLYFFGSKKTDDRIGPESALTNVSGKLYGTTTNWWKRIRCWHDLQRDRSDG
jgi:uncharacterized repeat protein (TIGR03803 family)